MTDKELKIGWIDIISKMYKNLHNSERVLHYSNVSDKKLDRLIKYFDRLEELHKKVSESKRKSDEMILKNFYYNLYVIKEENIPESYFRTQVRILRERGYGNVEINDVEKKQIVNQIIEDQKRSLDKWIEYFLYDEESKSYEMWEKYWVFQGIQSLGKYDKETGKFSKRDKNTTYPFPPVEREYVFTTLKLMEEYIKNKTGDNEIKSALGSGNFKQLYEYVIKQSMINGKYQSISTQGKWVKYEQGSKYNKLINSLQGYYTGWCTAAGENFAKTQLENGDFYVYYSLNENGEAKVPRIAIRMDGTTKIGEIRGIASNQNMEAEMMPILNEKLKEFPDRDKYYKKENDMNMLTLIDNKVKDNKELTIKELRFLYEIGNTIEGFGYGEDPRINEIKSKRNVKKDYAEILNISEEEVALSKDEWRKNCKNIKIFIGTLDLSDLSIVEDLVLPPIVRGDLFLNNLKTYKNLVLPQIVLGILHLANLETTKDLVFPQVIGAHLILEHLKIVEDLTLPQIIGGSLYLNNLKTAKCLVLPEMIEDNLNLESLETFEGLTMPQTIGKNLYLNNLKSSKGLVLPQTIEGNLYLNCLKTIGNLVLPQTIGGNLNLKSLETAEGLMLPYDFDLRKLRCNDNLKTEIINNPSKYYRLPSDYEVMEENSLIK